MFISVPNLLQFSEEHRLQDHSHSSHDRHKELEECCSDKTPEANKEGDPICLPVTLKAPRSANLRVSCVFVCCEGQQSRRFSLPGRLWPGYPCFYVKSLGCR